MNGLSRIFSALRTLCSALPVVLGFAIILASVVSASSTHVEHFASNDAHVIAMSDHAFPADKKDQDHKSHATCGVGVCSFAFIVPAEVATTPIPFSAVIESANVVQLVTRIVAPPLPPPKIIILV